VFLQGFDQTTGLIHFGHLKLNLIEAAVCRDKVFEVNVAAFYPDRESRFV